MSTPCKFVGPIAVGDAVCLVNSIGGDLYVAAATQPNLDDQKAVYGRVIALDGPTAHVETAGGATAPGVGSIAGDLTTRVVTDLNNPALAAQSQLISLPAAQGGIPFEPALRRQFAVGSANDGGALVVLPTQLGVNVPVTFDVRTFGARGDSPGSDQDSNAFFDAIAAMGPLLSARGAVLLVPRPPSGTYHLKYDLRLPRQVSLRGAGGAGRHTTDLTFAPGKGVIFVDEADSPAGPPGTSSILENIDVHGTPLDLFDASDPGKHPDGIRRWPPSTPVVRGWRVVAPASHLYYYVCTRAGTTTSMDPFGEGPHVLGYLEQEITRAEIVPGGYKITCPSHGYAAGMWVVWRIGPGSPSEPVVVISATRDDFVVGTAGAAPAGTVKRVVAIHSSMKAGPSDRVKVAAQTPIAYPNGTYVRIVNHTATGYAVSEGTFAVELDPTDPLHVTFWLDGTNSLPTGSGTGGYLEAVIPDGDPDNFFNRSGAAAALWTAHAHSGIILETPASVRNCYVDGYLNAGILVDGVGRLGGISLNTLRGGGFELTSVWVGHCGIGITPVGDIGGGVCRDALVSNLGEKAPWAEQRLVPGSNPPKNETVPLDAAGYGIWDLSTTGCTWLNCQVAQSMAATFVAGGGPSETCEACLIGCYMEIDSPPAKIAHPAVVVGGSVIVEEAPSGPPPVAATKGMYLASLDSRNLAFRSDEWRTAGGLGQEGGRTAFWFGHDDDFPVRFRYRYVRGHGEWVFEYGRRGLFAFPTQRGTEGKGTWRDVHGHFLADQFFGPASGLTDKHVRSNWIAAGSGREQFWLGDQLWTPGDGTAGSFAGLVVRTPGFRGLPWREGPYIGENAVPGTDEAADLVEVLELGAPRAKVFKCMVGGYSGVEPVWSSWLAPGEVKVGADGLTWLFLGYAPEYNLTGLIRDEGENDLDETVLAITDSATYTNVDSKIRRGRTRVLTITGATGTPTITGFTRPRSKAPTGTDTGPAQLLVHREGGFFLKNEGDAASTGANENKLRACPSPKLSAASLTYNPGQGRWFCNSFTVY